MKDILVAVYGSLRQGLHNHAVLGGSELVGEDTTTPNYTMVSLGSFPAVHIGGDTPITIEVYKVNEEIFHNLDRLEGYPHFYNRTTIDTKYGKAWMYFIDDAPLATNKVVENGDWADYLSTVRQGVLA